MKNRHLLQQLKLRSPKKQVFNRILTVKTRLISSPKSQTIPVVQCSLGTADHSVMTASSPNVAYRPLVQGTLRLQEAVLLHMGAVLLPLAELVVGAGNAGIMPRMQLLPKRLKG